jgi:hypothetical protein
LFVNWGVPIYKIPCFNSIWKRKRKRKRKKKKEGVAKMRLPTDISCFLSALQEHTSKS